MPGKTVTNPEKVVESLHDKIRIMLHLWRRKIDENWREWTIIWNVLSSKNVSTWSTQSGKYSSQDPQTDKQAQHQYENLKHFLDRCIKSLLKWGSLHDWNRFWMSALYEMEILSVFTWISLALIFSTVPSTKMILEATTYQDKGDCQFQKCRTFKV